MEKNAVNTKYELVVIGGSAGSLSVIINILSRLKGQEFAVIIILHRKTLADSILASLLSSHTSFFVKEAEEKEALRPGVVYLAPADYHVLIEKDGTISLDDSEKVNFSRPSIDVTFESAGEVYGSRVAGVLLSGGNHDGTEGLKRIAEFGGHCIVQDPLGAEVPYMPQYAISSFKPDIILQGDKLPDYISKL